MLEISDLVCRYGKVEAIKGISLSIRQGQLVGIDRREWRRQEHDAAFDFGDSAVGFRPHDLRGRRHYALFGQEILARGIAHCPEGRRVFPDMTVEENLDMGAYLRNDS